MPDFSVTGIVTIDNTQSILSAQEVMDAAERAAEKIAMLRRKALSTISLVNGMVNQAYGVLKQLVTHAGGIVDPMFDMMFTMIGSVISTALSSAIMLMSTLNPILIGVGIGLMILSTALNIKATADLHAAQGTVEKFMEQMKRGVAAPPTRSPFGVGF